MQIIPCCQNPSNWTGIAAFLLDSDETDLKIARFSTLVKLVRSFDDLIALDNQKNCLLEAVRWRIEEDSRLMFFFYRPFGTGKRLAIEAFKCILYNFLIYG